MDPRWLLPLLAAAFAAWALRQWLRGGAGHPALRAWALLAFIFAAVSVWLHTAG